MRAIVGGGVQQTPSGGVQRGGGGCLAVRAEGALHGGGGG